MAIITSAMLQSTPQILVSSSSSAKSIFKTSHGTMPIGDPATAKSLGIKICSLASEGCSSFISREYPMHFQGARGMSMANSKNYRVLCSVAEVLGSAQSSEETTKAVVGSRVKVKGPLKVYHVPKVPEFDIAGLEGEVKDILGVWKGKPVSANLPYKVQFLTDIGGRQVKFFAHLKDGEFDVVS